MSRNVNTTQFMILIVFAFTTSGVFGIYQLIDETSISWESIGSPPEKPIRFVAGQVGDYPGGETYYGRETTIYVETLSGNIYRCCSDGNASWVKTAKSDAEEWNWAEECLANKEDENRKHLENEIDNYAFYWCGEADYGHVPGSVLFLHKFIITLCR